MYPDRHRRYHFSFPAGLEAEEIAEAQLAHQREGAREKKARALDRAAAEKARKAERGGGAQMADRRAYAAAAADETNY